jgi:hypothetical protein
MLCNFLVFCHTPLGTAFLMTKKLFARLTLCQSQARSLQEQVKIHSSACKALFHPYVTNSTYGTESFLKLVVAQMVKKFLASYGTRMFIAVFTKVRHCSLSWARWIQSTLLYLVSLRSVSSLQSCVLSSGFPIKILYAVVCFVTRPSHLP